MDYQLEYNYWQIQTNDKLLLQAAYALEQTVKFPEVPI